MREPFVTSEGPWLVSLFVEIKLCSVLILMQAKQAIMFLLFAINIFIQ